MVKSLHRWFMASFLLLACSNLGHLRSGIPTVFDEPISSVSRVLFQPKASVLIAGQEASVQVKLKQIQEKVSTAEKRLPCEAWLRMNSIAIQATALSHLLAHARSVDPDTPTMFEYAAASLALNDAEWDAVRQILRSHQPGSPHTLAGSVVLAADRSLEEKVEVLVAASLEGTQVSHPLATMRRLAVQLDGTELEFVVKGIQQIVDQASADSIKILGIHTLGALGGKARCARHWLHKQHQFPELRDAAQLALTRIQTSHLVLLEDFHFPEALRLDVDALTRQGPETTEAMQRLAALGPEALGALLIAARVVNDEPFVSNALRVISEWQDEIAEWQKENWVVPKLLESAIRSESGTQQIVVQALGQHRWETIPPVFAKLVQSTDMRVKRAVRRALIAISAQCAEQARSDLAKLVLDDLQANSLSHYLVRDLVHVLEDCYEHAPELIPQALVALQHSDGVAAEFLVEFLVKIGLDEFEVDSPQRLAILKGLEAKLLHSPDAEVRQTCVWAIGEFATDIPRLRALLKRVYREGDEYEAATARAALESITLDH